MTETLKKDTQRISLPLGSLLLHKCQEIERYRALVDICPMPMFLRSSDGSQLYANRSYQELLGRAWEELEGWGWTNALEPVMRDEVLAQWVTAVRGGVDFQYIARYVRPDLSIVHANVQATKLTSHTYAGFCSGCLGAIEIPPKITSIVKYNEQR